VVVSGSPPTEPGPATVGSPTPRVVVWHDLECGAYRADLPLWHELAERHPGPVLDVGAGTGRVSLALARAGHEVTALDLDPILLGALAERGAGMPIHTQVADARSFAADRSDFALCVVPMQTIQLLDGAEGRLALLRCARACLRPGGLLACAILSALEPFDCADGDLGPDAERVRLDGLLFISRATRVSEGAEKVVIERERRILPDRERTGARALGIEDSLEHDVIELDRVDAQTIEREASEVGLRPEPARHVAATEDHSGSEVVMLRV
jgi:SAM-dependent methyltransferase